MTRFVYSVLVIFLWLGVSASFVEAMDIVRNGEPRVTIVIPDDALEVVRSAAEELQYHVRKSTGATLPIVKESVRPSEKSCIFLGATQEAKKAGIDAAGVGPSFESLTSRHAATRSRYI